MDFNRKIFHFEFNFPIEDYVCISERQVVACSKQGWLSIVQKDYAFDKYSVVTEFQIDISENEIVTKMSYYYNEDDLVIAIADKDMTKATKLLIFEVISSSDTVTLIQQSCYDFLNGFKNEEIEPIVDVLFDMRLDFNKTMLVLFTKNNVFAYTVEDNTRWISIMRKPFKLTSPYKSHILYQRDQIWVLLQDNNILLLSKSFLLSNDEEEEEENDDDLEDEVNNVENEENVESTKNDENGIDNDKYEEECKKIVEAHLHNKEREEFVEKIKRQESQHEEERDYDDIGGYIETDSEEGEEEEEESD